MNKTVGGGQILSVARDHLAFLDHMHEFDPVEGHPGRAKGFESQHRSNDPFDGAVILLDSADCRLLV